MSVLAAPALLPPPPTRGKEKYTRSVRVRNFCDYPPSVDRNVPPPPQPPSACAAYVYEDRSALELLLLLLLLFNLYTAPITAFFSSVIRRRNAYM